MQRGQYPLEAVLTLPAGLLLEPSFLGLLKNAKIGGVPVHVVLPDFSFEDDKFTTVLHPRAEAKWVDYYAKVGDDARWPFGKVSQWHPEEANGGIKEFSAHRLLVLSKDRVTLAQARRLLEAADAWVERLESWIEVFTQTDLYREMVSVEKDGRSAYVWLNEGEGRRGKKKGRRGKTVSSAKPIRVVLMSGSPLALTPRDWGRLLLKASSGDPPEAHLFLRDARHELNSGRYRRSVLDSATAAEVALAKLRDDYLIGGDAKVHEYVAEKARQLRWLEEFLRAVGIELPGAISQDISKPRNDAIHEGHKPSQETAGKALSKAAEVVDLAFPHKKLI